MDFKMEMRGFYMHSVCLPEKVTKHFSNLSGQVLELKRQGDDTWQVGLIGSSGKLILQPGWSSFASANNISQNDLLLFKFMGKSKFEVQIFDSNGCEKLDDSVEFIRATKSGSLKSDIRHVEESQKDEIKMPTIKGSVRSLCKLKLKRLRNSSDGCSYNKGESEKRCDELDKKMGQNQVYLAGEETGKCVASNNEVIYQGSKEVLTADQERRAKQLRNKVQAKNPAFLKVIRASNRTSKSGIKIPTKFSAEQLPKETWDVVLCRPKKEMTWPVKYYYRKGCQSFEGTQWRKFVLGNNLQEGDICMFEMVKCAKEITFVVHISSAISSNGC